MRTSKIFSKELYDQHDHSGKTILIKYFSKKGLNVVEDPFGKYGIDLAVFNNEKVFYVDSEVRETWDCKKFPFKTIHLPFRKNKFLDIGSVFFCSISKDLSQAYFIDGNILKKCSIIKLNNKYAEAEDFFDIPVKICHYRNLEVKVEQKA